MSYDDNDGCGFMETLYGVAMMLCLVLCPVALVCSVIALLLCL